MFWNVFHIVGNQTIPFTYLGKNSFSSFWARSSRPIRLQDSSNVHYWRTVWFFFLKLCMKLGVHKGEKVSVPDFWGKFPFCPNWAKMAQKWTFCIYFKFLFPWLREIPFQPVLDPKINQESNEPIYKCVAWTEVPEMVQKWTFLIIFQNPVISFGWKCPEMCSIL